MIDFEELHDLRRLLDRHAVSASNWLEMNQRGFSGARIYKQVNTEGGSYVLKITSAQTDWIMQATSDHACREARLANAACLRHGRVSSPALGSAQDGCVVSILMQDISEYLLSNQRLTHDQLETILLGMSCLHSLTPPLESQVPWCSIEDRLTLFMPDAEKLAHFRIGNEILRGWQLFFDYSPKHSADLVRCLFADMAPLQRALEQLPNCLLHGDLKLDNIGIRNDGTLSLIDWSMPMIAPAAIDLGWFLAMNSRALPISLDATLAAYASHANIEPRLRERHQSLTILCGLLIRGWRKGLDAVAGEPSELLWWCEHAASAAKML